MAVDKRKKSTKLQIVENITSCMSNIMLSKSNNNNKNKNPTH